MYPSLSRRTQPPALALLAAALALCAAGCLNGPRAYGPPARKDVDRRFVEYPTGLQLDVVADGFTAATALAVAPDGGVFVADHGGRGEEVRITRVDPATGEAKQLYPARDAPFAGYFDDRQKLYGPVGGMACHDGQLFAGARDADDRGVVVAFDLAAWTGTGRPPLRTVVGDLPAQGDHGVTALAVHPLTGRLFFGVGSATNSGVVGVDNWQVGWLKEHPDFHDQPLTDLKVGGYRFDTEDPAAGLLNPDKVNTAPFNAFRTSDQRIPAAPDAKPTAALYSVDPRGGDLRVEAHGLRDPRGLAFNSYANLYASNDGMDLRGTRPVKDDPDVVVRVPLAASLGPFQPAPPPTWFGWPDYSADLRSITEKRFQPPTEMLARTGYRELSPLIDPGSGLEVADRGSLLTAVFPSLSGAAGMAFVPEAAPAGFGPYRGMIVVALGGDRAPFATSGLPLAGPVGFKVVVVDPDRRTAEDFLTNVPQVSESPLVMKRPRDVAFGPGGAMYLLDLGELQMRGGRERYKRGTGKLYRLAPPGLPTTTRPTTGEASEERRKEEG